MEQILKHYGGGVLAAVAGLLLLGVLFFGVSDADGNQGILKMAGAKMQTEGTNYTLFQDFKQVQEEAKKPEPEITETFAGNVLRAGCNYAVSDYVQAIDAEGNIYPVQLEKIIDEEGAETGVSQSIGNGILNFPKSGIYIVQVLTENDAGKKKRYQIAVSVARAEE